MRYGKSNIQGNHVTLGGRDPIDIWSWSNVCIFSFSHLLNGFNDCELTRALAHAQRNFRMNHNKSILMITFNLCIQIVLVQQTKSKEERSRRIVSFSDFRNRFYMSFSRLKFTQKLISHSEFVECLQFTHWKYVWTFLFQFFQLTICTAPHGACCLCSEWYLNIYIEPHNWILKSFLFSSSLISRNLSSELRRKLSLYSKRFFFGFNDVKYHSPRQIDFIQVHSIQLRKKSIFKSKLSIEQYWCGISNLPTCKINKNNRRLWIEYPV